MPKVTRLTLDQGGGLERRRLHLREISDDADAPLENVGQDLRKGRQRKGEDLARISGILKIRKDYLHALEESNFDAIPGRAYAIGFVRAYADYLGLDGKEFVERLKTEIAGRSEGKEGAVQVSSPRERVLPPGGLIFAAVLLIAVIYGGYYLVSANRMTTPGVTPVPPRLTEQAGLAPNGAAQAPEPAAASPPILADSPAPAPAPAATVAAPLPAGQKYGAQNSGGRVALVAHKPTRVLVQGPNNTLLFNRLLQPGDSYLVPVRVRGVTLSTPDGGAVELILDGKSMGYAGKDGTVAEGLSLNPQDVINHQGHG
jgi:cytoskeleton protein RodZ